MLVHKQLSLSLALQSNLAVGGCLASADLAVCRVFAQRVVAATAVDLAIKIRQQMAGSEQE